LAQARAEFEQSSRHLCAGYALAFLRQLCTSWVRLDRVESEGFMRWHFCANSARVLHH